MLTKRKLKIYKKYKGDPDWFIKAAFPWEAKLFEHNDWSLIDDFIQQLYLVQKGLAAKDFIDGLNRTLRDNCDNEETIKILETFVHLFPMADK